MRGGERRHARRAPRGERRGHGRHALAPRGGHARNGYRARAAVAAIRAAVSALETAGITVLGLEEGEQRVTLLVKRDDEDAALCAVHDALVPR